MTPQQHSELVKRIDITKAHAYQVVANFIIDPNYSPYCLRCVAAVRMNRTSEPLLWDHHCGATHDERQVLT